MSEEISISLRTLVRQRAGGCCEYCGMPDTEPVFPHEPDHIIAIKHGGPTTSEMNDTIEIPVEPGRHTLQLRNCLSRA